MISSYRDLKVYQLSYSLAIEIFQITTRFPRQEVYSLTDQIRRATRSIAANIAEGWAKRHYENVFRRHLIDAIGSCQETKVWLDFALDCQYITRDDHERLMLKYDQLGKMLYSLFENWQTYEN